MATVTNKRIVLSVEGNTKVIRHITTGGERGEKRNWRVLGIWSRTFYDPKIWKNRNKLLVCWNRTDREHSDFESPKEVTSMKLCLSGLSKSEVAMYRQQPSHEKLCFSCTLSYGMFSVLVSLCGSLQLYKSKLCLRYFIAIKSSNVSAHLYFAFKYFFFTLPYTSLRRTHLYDEIIFIRSLR
jgi:hypothetical protein